MQSTQPIASKSRPHIIAFYGFRGGIGRTIAAYNIANLMGATGRRVLLIDMDVEVPGITFSVGTVGEREWIRDLEARFLDNPKSKNENPGPGVTELLVSYMTDSSAGDWFGDNSHKIILPIPENLNLEGRSVPVTLMPAASYNQRGYRGLLDRFQEVRPKLVEDRNEFAKHLGEYLKKTINELGDYDYVIIDCSSGNSEISTLACRYLADIVVMFSGLSDQHLEGTIHYLNEILAPDDNTHSLSQILDPDAHSQNLPSPVVSDDASQSFPSVLLVVGPVSNSQSVATLEQTRELIEAIGNRVEAPEGFDILATQAVMAITHDSSVSLRKNLAHPGSLDGSLWLDYQQIHQRIRKICDDGVSAWVAETRVALRGRHFFRAISTLETIRSIESLGGTLEHQNFQNQIDRVGEYLFNLNPADLRIGDSESAEPLLTYLTGFQDDSPYPFWVLARIATELQDTELAQAWWIKAEEILKMFGDDDQLRILQMEQSLINDRWGMGVLPGGSEEYAEVTLRDMLARKILPPSANLGLALTRHALAEVARIEGRYTESEEQLLQALTIHKDMGDSLKEATTIHSIGLLRRLMGDYKNALDHIRSARDMKFEKGDIYGANIANHSLGEVFRLIGAFEDSMKCFNETIEYGIANDQPQARAVGYLTLGELNRTLRKFDDAAENLKQVIAIADPNRENRPIELELAKLRFEATRCQGDTAYSISALERLIKDAPSSLNPQAEIVARLLLCEVFLDREDLAALGDESRIVASLASTNGMKGYEADANAINGIARSMSSSSGRASESLGNAVEFYEEQDVKTPLAIRARQLWSSA